MSGEATRAEGLRRLETFLPRAGKAYARDRNVDFGPDNRTNISSLSPYLRHRLIGEEEVARAVLRRHHMADAARFIEQLCWRAYFKGWLEQRPSIWTEFCDERAREAARVEADSDLRQRYTAAMDGETGIAPFDAWMRELTATGTLHNHARMWVASIWIFTLRLPWTLGADFFYRHLLDGDAASNTLSWRWVAGLHTRGKHYLARADNIRQFTNGRFDPAGQLNEDASALEGPELPPAMRLRRAMSVPPNTPVILLLGEDDLSPEHWPVQAAFVKGVAACAVERSYPGLSDPVLAFRSTALQDALSRAEQAFACPVIQLQGPDDAATLGAFARACGVDLAVASQVPVGPARMAFDALVANLQGTGLAVLEVRRDWDRAFWPHAGGGYFKLKERIPETLEQLGLL